MKIFTGVILTASLLSLIASGVHHSIDGEAASIFQHDPVHRTRSLASAIGPGDQTYVLGVTSVQIDTDGDTIPDSQDPTPQHDVAISISAVTTPGAIDLSNTLGSYMWVSGELLNLSSHQDSVTIDVEIIGVPDGCDFTTAVIVPGQPTFSIDPQGTTAVSLRTRFECHAPAQPAAYPITVTLCVDHNAPPGHGDETPDQQVNNTAERDLVIIVSDGPPSDIIGPPAPLPSPVCPQPFEIDIDIKPDGFPNSINLSRQHLIPVVILGAPGFDPTDVDPGTLSFEGARPARHALQDIDGDGNTDLILLTRIQDTGIQPEQVIACVQGSTVNQALFMGCDTIRVVASDSDLDADSLGFGVPPLFGDDVESSLGTNPLDNCAVAGIDNAWPPDLNNDGRFSLADSIAFILPFGQVLGDPGYEPRLDFVFDGRIDLADVLTPIPFLNLTCTVPAIDTDGDTVVDTKDIDADNDGFSDVVELYLGTNHLNACAPDGSDDAWPPDPSMDGQVDEADVQLVTDAIDVSLKIVPGNIRFDLDADGAITTSDRTLIQTYVGSQC